MVDIDKIEKKIDKGASILWFGAIFGGLSVILVGLLWFLDIQEFVEIDMWSICSILLILTGIALIGVALWLRSMILE